MELVVAADGAACMADVLPCDEQLLKASGCTRLRDNRTWRWSLLTVSALDRRTLENAFRDCG
jgi:hypothetical protein